jgi:transcriptional regulator with XRE-family HTH domain
MLRNRNISLRALAAAINISPSHLSRALRGEEGKHLSLEAFEAIAAELNVQPSFFREYRTELAVGGVRAQVELANLVFDRLDPSKRYGTSSTGRESS